MHMRPHLKLLILLLALLKLAGLPALAGISWLWWTVPLLVLGLFQLWRLLVTLAPAIAAVRSLHRMMREAVAQSAIGPNAFRSARGVVIEGEIIQDSPPKR
jgi:hypothetical protein